MNCPYCAKPIVKPIPSVAPDHSVLSYCFQEADGTAHLCQRFKYWYDLAEAAINDTEILASLQEPQ